MDGAGYRRLQARAKALVVRVWTIADFRNDNGGAIRQVCARFVALSHLGLFTEAVIAIEGSKLKAVNNRDENFTRANLERRMAQIEESVS